MQGLRDGRALLGGAHGNALMVAGEIYGVVGRYMASLAGFGPCEQPPWRRAACLTFSAASLPFQFIPLVAALRTKAGERAVVRQALTLWNPCSRAGRPRQKKRWRCVGDRQPCRHHGHRHCQRRRLDPRRDVASHAGRRVRHWSGVGLRCVGFQKPGGRRSRHVDNRRSLLAARMAAVVACGSPGRGRRRRSAR